MLRIVNDRIFNNLHELMIQENITGKQLAFMSGISESEISDIKHGHKIPNQFTMIQLCSALEKEMHEVFEIDYKNVKFM